MSLAIANACRLSKNLEATSIMATADDLKEELTAYEKRKDELIETHGEGKFVLVHGAEIAGVWDSYGDALKSGYEKFGLQPFLVKQLQAIEQAQFVTRNIFPCQS